MSGNDTSVWCFTNSQNRMQRITILGLQSAKSFVSILRREELIFWLVKQDDGKEIFALKCLPLFNKEPQKPAVPEIATIQVLRDKETEKGGGRERRKHKRIRARLNVMVIREKDIFQVCTKDISMGGLMLENPVPRAFLGHLCTVVISSPDNSLHVEFEATILEASARGSRIMFETMSDLHIEKLKRWISMNDPDFRLTQPLFKNK